MEKNRSRDRETTLGANIHRVPSCAQYSIAENLSVLSRTSMQSRKSLHIFRELFITSLSAYLFPIRFFSRCASRTDYKSVHSRRNRSSRWIFADDPSEPLYFYTGSSRGNRKVINIRPTRPVSRWSSNSCVRRTRSTHYYANSFISHIILFQISPRDEVNTGAFRLKGTTKIAQRHRISRRYSKEILARVENLRNAVLETLIKRA